MTTPSPADGLRECLALLEKATPGEWHCFAGSGNARATVHSARGHIAFCTMRNPSPTGAGLDRAEMEANAAVIAAAINTLRTHGPALLAALRLREGCEGLVADWHEQANNYSFGGNFRGCAADLARVLEESATGGEAGSA